MNAISSQDVLIAGLLLLLSLASYVDRIYTEMGRFLAREYEDNIEAWTRAVEPKLHLGRESVALSASVLRQLALAAIALIAGLRLYTHVKAMPALARAPSVEETALTAGLLVLLILFFDRLVPQLLFTRTRGLWIARIRYPMQALFYLILPVTLMLGLLLSIVALAEPEDSAEEERPSEAVEALLEAGEEEGILEESDRELVRSVVEFGDKVVREVMTPRPEIFAVRETLTLAEFLDQLKENGFSRVPVYAGSLDQITGIAFARDLLQAIGTEAMHSTVKDLQREAEFVPETKNVSELLREMQLEKQHLRIVIDEYGGVAGLVTIEDLLEAIVGSIDDEHDEGEESNEPVREADGSFVVPGSFEVSRLRELFSEQLGPASHEDEESESVEAEVEEQADSALRNGSGRHTLPLPPHYEATTLGGLVSEMAGHIPMPGEVVEEDGLRLEVLASTERKVERVRVSLRQVSEQANAEAG
ncbi:MAG TPA: hemolysin family protein [Acidobacteriaceae bacterium]|nr:hemolysin family protein [Acidobacteriaceae bacterium]